VTSFCLGAVQSPRDALGTVLADIAARDDRLVVIDADLGRSTGLAEYERRFPDRFVQVGVAEQNALGIATGLAYAGYRPVFVSFAMFAVGLTWTQLRQAAYAGLPVTVIGTHPGLDAGPDGGTHQMCEDLALTRTIPELAVLAPADTSEVAAAVEAAYRLDRVAYVRIGRYPVPDLHAPVSLYPEGRGEVLRAEGTDCLFVAEGSGVWVSLQAAEQLAKDGIGARVLNARWIKPFDVELLRAHAAEVDLVVTVENHSALGGLGGVVAEVLTDPAAPILRPVLRLGTDDLFGESGSLEDLRIARGLTPDAIAARTVAVLRDRTSERPSH